MGEKWVCSNCGAENELKFCTKCGAPKPEEVIPEVKAEDNSWNCACGHEGNTGNFCRNCGLPKEQGAVLKMAEEVAAEPVVEAEAVVGVAAAAGAAFEEAVPEVEVPEVEIPEVELPEEEIPEVEIPEMEIPDVEIPEVEIPEVEIPEAEIPEVEIPEMEAPVEAVPEEIIPEAVIAKAGVPDDGTWDCTCGHTGNKGNFCRNCGLPKEQGMTGGVAAVLTPTINQTNEQAEEIPPVMPMPAPESGPWDCPCGQKGNEGKFCKNCGTPREQGFAPADTPLAAAKAAFTEEAPAMQGPEVAEPPVDEPKKKKSLKPLIFIIGGAVVLAAIIVALVLILGNNRYTTNKKPQAEVLVVDDDSSLFIDKDRDISFLYPEDLTADKEFDGDYIYGEYFGSYPYIQIDRVNEKIKPKDYFKRYQYNLKVINGDMDFSKMEKVEIEGKTLYVVQTYLPLEGVNQDQYLELYDDCYITYTVKGYESSTGIGELDRAIGSLRTAADAYPVPEALVYENNLGNYSVEILPDYKVEELDGGFSAEKGNAKLFASYIHTDSIGSIVYGRDDFLDLWSKVSGYVEDILAVETVDYLDSSTTEKINGKDFIVYPVRIVLDNGNEAEGKLCVGDSDNTIGCYLMCYYLESNSGSLLKEECENFLQSMSVHGDPNIKELAIEDLSSQGFGLIAVRKELLGKVDIQDGKVVIHNPEDTQTITFVKRQGADLYEDIASPLAQDIANQYDRAHVAEIDPPKDGRYYFDACEITYTTDKNVNRVFRIYCISTSSSEKNCVEYDVEVGKEDWVNEVCSDIFWSWKRY
ncbi:MAG: zinc ribbon domain-containing protein [Lachnospiraceae bacterium]|nr:zinc ribbon domain-containing protein [Lachnospiraceae bacterium]